MSKPVVRRAQTADRRDVLALLAAQFEEHAIALPGAELEAAVDGVLADPARGLFLIALVDGIAVGLACVAFTWTLEHGGKSAWLDELYVATESRGQGLGTHLLHAACAEAALEGAVAIDLEVERSHARAVHLYARHGFVRHDRERWVLALRPPRGPFSDR